MASCAGCGSEAAPHLCSRCQQARYCSRPCQTGHWKQHKRKCKPPAPSSEIKAESSGSAGPGACAFSCPECTRPWADCVCADPPVCWICFDHIGELLRGCACRGTAGYVHVACMVEANRHRKIAHDQCPTCEQSFVGALSMALAEARVRDNRASSSNIDRMATSNLADACCEQGRYGEALGHFRNVLRQDLQRFGHDHPDTATTQNNIGTVLSEQGKLSQALEMHNQALKTRVDVLGPEHLVVAKTQNKCACMHVHMYPCTCVCAHMQHCDRLQGTRQVS